MKSCVGEKKGLGISCRRTAGGGALRWTGEHERESNASRVGSERVPPALNENKNVRHNCLKTLSPDESHWFRWVVGWLSLPFSHNMGSPAKSLTMD